MSELSPIQTIQLLLEATGLSQKYSGSVQVIHAQNWGVRHILVDGKTHFIDKRYKMNLVPALKAIASPLLHDTGGIITYRLHDGISVDIKFESYVEQAEVKTDIQRNRNTYKMSAVLFRSVMNRMVFRNWVEIIRRSKSSTPLNQLKIQYAKLA